MRTLVALCLVLLITAVNGGALTLAQSLGDGVTAPVTVSIDVAGAQTALEECCQGEVDKVLPRSVAPCATDCHALIPTVAPPLALSDAQGGWISSYALTEGPGQIWQRPPRA